MAGKLAGWGIRPNTISIGSAVMASLGGAAIVVAGRVESQIACSVLFLAAAVFIQLRLLCNLLDGMVAVEGKMGTRSGELFNDVPDRISDVVLFIAAGYAIVQTFPSAEVLAWAAACLSITTAYVRMLGAASGVGHCFFGPMAKPQRMAILTIGCLMSAIEVWFWMRCWSLWIVLAVVVIGAVLTALRRLIWIYRQLESDAKEADEANP